MSLFPSIFLSTVENYDYHLVSFGALEYRVSQGVLIGGSSSNESDCADISKDLHADCNGQTQTDCPTQQRHPSLRTADMYAHDLAFAQVDRVRMNMLPDGFRCAYARANALENMLPDGRENSHEAARTKKKHRSTKIPHNTQPS